MEEIWRDIKGYEGKYQISNYGNVKSLKRLDNIGRLVNERILKHRKHDNGYYYVNLCDGIKCKSKKNHQLVAMAFLNHTPNGSTIVVNHKDFNRQNNHIDNLELITQRENTNQKHLKSSSKYVGVHYNNGRGKKWRSVIRINGKQKYLGCFDNEYEAYLSYKKALGQIKNPLV